LSLSNPSTFLHQDRPETLVDQKNQ
jgi:hypothetical protein